MANSKSFLLYICQILQSEMGLAKGQISIYNQRRRIPKTLPLWIVVRYLTGKPYGTKSGFIDGVETQCVHVGAQVTIRILSADDSALQRKEEIQAALQSIFSQQIQQKYSFKIGRLPVNGPIDISEIEGASIPYSFEFTYNVQYKTELQKNVDYYDTFQNPSLTVED